MTAIMPKDEVQKLLDEFGSDILDHGFHEEGMLMRHLRSVGDVILAAHDEMDRLRAEVERVQSDRQYVIGANDGWDAAVEQGEASPAVGKAMVRFWKKLAETHNTRADRLAADNAHLAARVEALVLLLAKADQALDGTVQNMAGTSVYGFRGSYFTLPALKADIRAALEAAILAAMTPAEQGEPR